MSRKRKLPRSKPAGRLSVPDDPKTSRKTIDLYAHLNQTSLKSKSTTGVAAIEVLFDHLFDDRTEKSVFPLKSALIFRDKPLEMMEQHPIEKEDFAKAKEILKKILSALEKKTSEAQNPELKSRVSDLPNRIKSK